MNDPGNVQAQPAPARALGHRFDHIGHWLVFAGGLIHGVGSKILAARNEELQAELAAAAERGRAAVSHAYELGRVHQAAGAPGLAADDLVETIGGMLADRENGLSSDAVTSGPTSAPQASTQAYVCPQCGPDPRGDLIHAEQHHTWPPGPDVDEHQGDELGELADRGAAELAL